MFRSFGWIAALILSSSQGFAQHPICGSPPPPPPISQQEWSKTKSGLDAKAQALLKLTGGELAGQIETERKTIYQSTDHTRAALHERYLAYQFCVLIMNDTTMTTPAKIKAN